MGPRHKQYTAIDAAQSTDPAAVSIFNVIISTVIVVHVASEDFQRLFKALFLANKHF